MEGIRITNIYEKVMPSNLAHLRIFHYDDVLPARWKKNLKNRTGRNQASNDDLAVTS